MSQKKKALPTVSSELHTISPLPIDLVAERIASLHYAGFPTQIDEYDGSFLIRSDGSKKAMLVGRIMRWNGTFTRVDASVKKQSLSLRDWASLILPIIGFSIVFFLFLLSIKDWLGFALALLIGWPAIILGPSLIYGGMRLGRMGDKKTRKALDEMMQALADKLCKNLPIEETALEFDGSELSLEMLLNDEKYKAFRLSADGELHTP